jgi:Radical SAM proteins, N-terminal
LFAKGSKGFALMVEISDSDFWVVRLPDSFGYNDKSEFDTADLRIIFLFPSGAFERSVSVTHSVIYNIVKDRFGSRVFVDFAMSPIDSVKYAYKKSGLPEWYGIISGREVKEFDIAGLSIAINVSDFVVSYQKLKCIEFPLDAKTRLYDSEYPLLVAGGIAATNSAILNDIVDFTVWGMGERSIPFLIDKALGIKEFKSHKDVLVDNVRGQRGFVIHSDYHYKVEVVDGRVEHNRCNSDDSDYDSGVHPDTSLDIQEFGGSYDRQWRLPFVFSQKKDNVLMSWGCSGSGLCSFCEEGNVYGVWRERSLQELDVALSKAKSSSMSETCNFHSFNSNFHSGYLEALMLVYKHYGRVASINFRADEVAHNPDLLWALKLLGNKSISLAVEGFGDRVRNDILNKNLSKRDFLVASKDVIANGFWKFKLGYIWTGLETQKDFDEGIAELEEVVKYRKELLKDPSIQVSITGLINMPHTEFWSKPRFMAVHSWREYFDSGYYYYPFKRLVDLGIRTKLTLRKGEGFFQQLLMDLGEMARCILLQPLDEGYKFWSREYFDRVAERLVEEGIDYKKQFLEFDSSRAWNQHLSLGRDTEGGEYCTKTNANLNPKCKGCGQCDEISKSYSKWVTKRELGGKINRARWEGIKVESSQKFLYAFTMVSDSNTRYVGKEALFRQILSDSGSEIAGFADYFRGIESSTFSKLEQECYPSGYCGMDLVVCSFNRDMGDLHTLYNDKFSDKYSRNAFIIDVGRVDNKRIDDGLLFTINVRSAEDGFIEAWVDKVDLNGGNVWIKEYDGVKVKKYKEVLHKDKYISKEWLDGDFSGKIVYVYVEAGSYFNPLYLFTRKYSISKVMANVKVDLTNVFYSKYSGEIKSRFNLRRF